MGRFVLAALLALGLIAPAYPHGGGLDGLGCHHNRKLGGYHCHRGPLAGQGFTSKSEALRALEGSNARQGPAAQPPAAQACCKVCRKGKACGNSCISASKTCRKPPGCACDAN